MLERVDSTADVLGLLVVIRVRVEEEGEQAGDVSGSGGIAAGTWSAAGAGEESEDSTGLIVARALWRWSSRTEPNFCSICEILSASNRVGLDSAVLEVDLDGDGDSTSSLRPAIVSAADTSLADAAAGGRPALRGCSGRGTRASVDREGAMALAGAGKGETASGGARPGRGPGAGAGRHVVRWGVLL